MIEIKNLAIVRCDNEGCKSIDIFKPESFFNVIEDLKKKGWNVYQKKEGALKIERHYCPFCKKK